MDYISLLQSQSDSWKAQKSEVKRSRLEAGRMQWTHMTDDDEYGVSVLKS